jgi:hypothetical protein
LILPVPEGEGELRPAKVKLTAGGDDMMLLVECSIVYNKFVIEMLRGERTTRISLKPTATRAVGGLN